VLTATNITLVKLKQPTVKGRGFVTSCRSRHETPQNVDSQPGKDKGKAPAGIPLFILNHETFVRLINSPCYIKQVAGYKSVFLNLCETAAR